MTGVQILSKAASHPRLHLPQFGELKGPDVQRTYRVIGRDTSIRYH